jgi:Domain of unknown function (DUF6285)
MHDSPSSTQLLTAVTDFLLTVAVPGLSGHAQFSARISANALALVKRELEGRSVADARAVQLYADLLHEGHDRDLAALEQQLCADIATGHLTMSTQGLLSALREVTSAQLAIDQPSYSGLHQ